MFSFNPFQSSSSQANNYNVSSNYASSSSNYNSMTVSGTLRTPAKPPRHNMCSGQSHCSSNQHHQQNY
ncbi:hypothetical protein I4U23_018990 [Adineta vaga]|nr:hypothetical protein I4U23_018990 [Adineta vaga]